MTEAHDDTNTMGLVAISTPLLFLAMVPILSIAFISWKLELKLASPIIVGTFRTFVQLTVLGLILQPIFVWGETHWWIVVGYALLMMLLAAHEAAIRSKYYFKGMYSCVLVSIITNITIVSIFAFGVIIRPKPTWNPQYVIPIIGMLLGNSITGIGLSLNSFLTALVEQQRQVELFLSFGASSFEASSGLVREALRAGAMPLLNTMAVIGIVSIPGMMTGQILGGSPVMEAARYQMLIMYLIGACAFGAILMELWIALMIAFDQSCILRNDRFIKRNETISFLDRIVALCRRKRREPTDNSDETTPLQENANYAPKGTLEVRSLRKGISSSLEAKLEVIGIQRSFPLADTDDAARQTLFKNFSFQVASGEIALVSGPSGVGKSQLLRTVAGLSAIDNGDIQLDGTSRIQFPDPTDWRKHVRYVTQYKVDIPGTPLDFIRQVTSFKSWRRDKVTPLEKEMLATTRELVQNWGLDASCVEKEWTLLSGGEAQRVIVALALASRPKVLLFDESTSSLDIDSKLRVERSVEEFATKFGISVLWITHDQEQAERMSK